MQRSDFVNELVSRGLLYQSTDLEGLKAALDKEENPAAYIGFDCTAQSLHAGNLMQIMMLRLLQKYGIKPIAILGGATSKIGDPSGRDTARDMMSFDTIQKNMLGIKQSLQKFIKFGAGTEDALLLNNADWLENVSYIELLRDYGQHFSINKMLTFEKIKSRLENQQNLSFLEFNYPVLQAYDFLQLNRDYNCILQFGGSDQWGNIISGVELIKKVTGKSAYGITTPLITTASGAKMGKSQSGAVWLNEEMLSAYDYYQFWRNTDDRDVFRFMMIYTDIPVDEIKSYEQEDKNINEFKKLLAFEATKLCHGEEAAINAQDAAIKMFEQGMADNMPEFQLESTKVESGIPLVQVLKDTGLASSIGDAKRLIKGKGARLNKITIEDENSLLTQSDFIQGHALLSAGRKHHIKLILKL